MSCGQAGVLTVFFALFIVDKYTPQRQITRCPQTPIHQVQYYYYDDI